MGLTTKPHKKPCPLGWVCKDKILQVTKQCDLKFAITSKFVDELEFDVVTLDTVELCWEVRTYMIEKKISIENIINILCLKNDIIHQNYFLVIDL